MAAVLLNQTCEELYRCILSCLTLHDRRTHSLHDLRDLAKQQDDRLRDARPRVTRFERRLCTDQESLCRGRYSGFYRISDDEVAWAGDRVERLHFLVDRACRDHLFTLGRGARLLVATAAVSSGGKRAIAPP